MIQKKKYSNLSKVVFKILTDLSGLENKNKSKKFKNIIKDGCIPTFYNDPKDQPFTISQKTFLALWN